MDVKVLLAAAALIAIPAVASADTNPNNAPIILQQTVTYPASAVGRFDGYPFMNDPNGSPQGIFQNGAGQQSVMYAWQNDPNGLPVIKEGNSTPTVVYTFQNDANGLPTGG